MNLEAAILGMLTAGDPLRPLPTTRELGEHFKVSHVTVSRVLRRMVETGALWQAGSGRFYRAEAEAQLARPHPIGCLVRSMSAWGAWYEGIMAGVGSACEVQSRSVLVHPVMDMIQQSGPGEKPTVLPEKKQRVILSRYLDRRTNDIERLLLDDSWSDAVLVSEASRLRGARLLLRPAPVSEMDACYPDYSQAALLGLSHLIARDFREIIFVQPYRDYATPKLMEEAFLEAFQRLGASSVDYSVFKTRGAEGFPELMQKLGRRRKHRVALVCPEDNFSVVLLRALEKSGIEVPDSVGLLGGMGTRILADAGVSRLVLDFAALGASAVTERFPVGKGPSLGFELQMSGTT